MLKSKNKIDILKRAIETYGEENQKRMAQEEAAELIQAISKDFRGKEHNVEEEIADLTIMLYQLELMYDENKIEYWINKKIERLNKRIEENQ